MVRRISSSGLNQKKSRKLIENPTGPAPEHVEIEEMDWMNQFKPVDNHIKPENGQMFETYGPEVGYVQQVAEEKPGHVWTLLDADGMTMIGDGYHHVNRLAYYITEVPADPNKTYEVYDEDERAPGRRVRRRRLLIRKGRPWSRPF